MFQDPLQQNQNQNIRQPRRRRNNNNRNNSAVQDYRNHVNAYIQLIESHRQFVVSTNNFFVSCEYNLRQILYHENPLLFLQRQQYSYRNEQQQQQQQQYPNSFNSYPYYAYPQPQQQPQQQPQPNPFTNRGLSRQHVVGLADFLNTTVTISPTSTQINNAVEEIAYREIVNPLNTVCPIMIEPFGNDEIVCQIRYCKHVFKKQPLMQWFAANVRCPVCRYDIRDYRNNREQRQEEEGEGEGEEDEEEGEITFDAQGAVNTQLPPLRTRFDIQTAGIPVEATSSSSSTNELNAAMENLIQQLFTSSASSDDTIAGIDLSGNLVFEFDWPLPSASRFTGSDASLSNPFNR